VIVYEMQTSALQSRVLSGFAARLTYHVGSGPSSRIAFPQAGPFDYRRGYSRLPDFEQRLETRGFAVTRQARMSRDMVRLEKWGIVPPYAEPTVAGLTIVGTSGAPLYEAIENSRQFERFEDVPSLMVRMLLFIENRELLTPIDPRSNPVIEWDRLAKATLTYAGIKLGLPLSLQGGSTLATQLEKYRHSPGGRTESPLEKLRQLAGASIKAYAEGPDTRPWRRRIVVDYLNTLPLAAAPGYGELYGMGDGLNAWFGLELSDVRAALASKKPTPGKAQAVKQVMALLIAVRAPSKYLLESRAALEAKVNEYARLMSKAGVLDPTLAHEVETTPLRFTPAAPVAPAESFVQRKASNAVRTTLVNMLGVSSFYDLDRLHLAVQSPVDVRLQDDVTQLLENLADPRFVAAHHLNGEHLLQASADPSKVIYSLMLFERTPVGNVLRVQADNLDRPFDINDGIKMELGSTAKLRTLAHYLELVAGLYHELSALPPAELAERARAARDPITKWEIETLQRERGLRLADLLQRALDRRYSASPYETFFTGGGVHSFGNFDRDDNGRILTIREALRRSVNLVFIRLMRDLVRYHQARLPYDPAAVLSEPDNPDRKSLLQLVAADEATHALASAYRNYRGLAGDAIVDKLLGRRATSPRHLAILFYAWNHAAGEEALQEWLKAHHAEVPPDKIGRLARAYGNPRLKLTDYAYLLSLRPLEVWVAGELAHDPQMAWHDLIARSTAPRQVATAWLFKTRHRHAQDRRLRIRIEQDAFARMTPYWRRLGFPFEHLVPSYATAIGSSSDRPAALAELMGIIVNDGMKRPLLRVTQLHFAEGTPYETVFEPAHDTGEQVMEPEVASALRGTLATVVSNGTARRLSHAFVGNDGKALVAGGKTGSGDNRYRTFSRGGGIKSERPVNRTATFVFYVGDRYFGVVTAYVPGHDAGEFEFTSALPVTVLKLAARFINARL